MGLVTGANRSGARPRPGSLWASAIAVALLAGACGSADTTSAGSSGPAGTGAPVSTAAPTTTDASPAPMGPEPAPEPVESDLPTVQVIDVATGGSVDVATLAPRDKPFLLWFWAPH